MGVVVDEGKWLVARESEVDARQGLEWMTPASAGMGTVVLHSRAGRRKERRVVVGPHFTRFARLDLATVHYYLAGYCK